jgi:hypothetical protein
MHEGYTTFSSVGIRGASFGHPFYTACGWPWQGSKPWRCQGHAFGAYPPDRYPAANVESSQGLDACRRSLGCIIGALQAAVGRPS